MVVNNYSLIIENVSIFENYNVDYKLEGFEINHQYHFRTKKNYKSFKNQFT